MKKRAITAIIACVSVFVCLGSIVAIKGISATANDELSNTDSSATAMDELSSADSIDDTADSTDDSTPVKYYAVYNAVLGSGEKKGFVEYFDHVPGITEEEYLRNIKERPEYEDAKIVLFGKSDGDGYTHFEKSDSVVYANSECTIIHDMGSSLMERTISKDLLLSEYGIQTPDDYIVVFQGGGLTNPYSYLKTEDYEYFMYTHGMENALDVLHPKAP